MIRCDHCGACTSAYAECCPTCGGYSTLFDDGQEPPQEKGSMAIAADKIGHKRERRVGTGFEAWDDALTGGLVIPQTAVIYGRPGSRKSSYAAAIAWNIGREEALYLCAEMPTDQIRDVTRRGFPEVGVKFAGNERGTTEWEKCEREVRRLRPPIVIYDSIQAFDFGDQIATSDLAIKGVVRSAIALCAELRHIAILISQVNVEGRPRCPMNIIHLCGTEIALSLTHVRVGKSWFGASREVRLYPEDELPLLEPVLE